MLSTFELSIHQKSHTVLCCLYYFCQYYTFCKEFVDYSYRQKHLLSGDRDIENFSIPLFKNPFTNTVTILHVSDSWYFTSYSITPIEIWLVCCIPNLWCEIQCDFSLPPKIYRDCCFLILSKQNIYYTEIFRIVNF